MLGIVDEAMVPVAAATRSIVVAAFVGLAIGGVAVLLWRAKRTGSFVQLIALGALIYCALGFVRIIDSPVSIPEYEPVALKASGELPDIYIVILDAYARQDTMREDFGFDNQPFLRELEARGFDVYRDAVTNYTRTASTLTSMLHMKPVGEVVPNPADDWNAQYAQLREALNAAPILDALRQIGYKVIALPPNIESVTLRSADIQLADGHLNEFERHLLRETGLIEILDAVSPDWIVEQHRDRIRSTFRHLTRVHDDPVFVMAHVISPHVPFVFNADGSPRALGKCEPDCWIATRAYDPREYAEGYTAQVEFVNFQTLAAVDALPHDAVVMVMGDHGSRHGDQPSEWFRTLFAARTPGYPRLFGMEPAPIDRLARLVNAYFGADVPLRSDGRFSAPGAPLDLVLRP